MKQARGMRIVLVTVPDIRVGRALAHSALKAKLIACANLVPRLESHYWWQGKIDRSEEVLMILKTTARNLNALEKLILEKHPYDTPEFVAVNPLAISERYLKWWLQSARRS